MFSYWEQQSFLRYDHIVIGGGLTGLQTAIELREQHPSHKILVLERSLIPYGASTRNAGFACMGSLTELVADIEQSGEEAMTSLFHKRLKGLITLRKRLGDEAIGYRENGSHEVITDKELPDLQLIDKVNELLRPVCGKNPFRIAASHASTFGLSAAWCKALIEQSCEGELHTGKLMAGLTVYCLQHGIEIKTGASATGFKEEDNAVAVFIPDPVRNTELCFKAGKLFICTNAFTPSLLPQAEMSPGRGQVLITKPVIDNMLKGIFHFEKGYYYFREIDGRILFGGGRHTDLQTETTDHIALNGQILADLKYKLEHFIMPGKPVEIDMTWSGIMAFGHTRLPIVEQHGERVYTAYRMGGMGVALSALAAKEVVEIAQDNEC